jgi:hypothetical protein
MPFSEPHHKMKGRFSFIAVSGISLLLFLTVFIIVGTNLMIRADVFPGGLLQTFLMIRADVFPGGLLQTFSRRWAVDPSPTPKASSSPTITTEDDLSLYDYFFPPRLGG